MSVTISSMTAIGTLATEDLFEVVDDPSGTPLSRKATGQQVADMVSGALFTPGSAGNLLTDDGDGTLTSQSNLTYDGTTIDLVGPSFPVLNVERTTAATTGYSSTFRCTTNTVGAAAENFGGRLLFALTDSGVTDQLMGGIGGVRGSNSTTGKVVISAYTSGTSGDIATFQDGLTSLTGDLTATGSISWGSANTLDADFVRVEGNFPNLQLREADGTTTHNQTTIAQNGDVLSFQTRDNTDGFVVSDYTSTKGASGAINHRFFIAGTDTLSMYSSGVFAPVGPLYVGTADTTQGILVLNGSAAGEGGEARFRNAGDQDTTDDYWFARADTDGLFNVGLVTTGTQLTLSDTTADFQDNSITTSGNITTTGGYMWVNRGGDAAAAHLYLQSDAAQNRDIHFRTGSSDRWIIRTNNTAESGSDAGSNFQIRRFDDSGVLIDAPIQIARSDGDVTIANGLFVTDLPTPTNYTAADDNVVTHLAGIDSALAGGGGVSVPLELDETTDSASVQLMRLAGNRATPADNDEGYISLELHDSGGTNTEFGRINWIATDVTDTTEDGAVEIEVMNAGTLTPIIRASHNSTQGPRLTIGPDHATNTPSLYENLVIDSDTTYCGIQMYSNGAGFGQFGIQFGNSSTNSLGAIYYSETGADTMTFRVASTTEYTINSLGVTNYTGAYTISAGGGNTTWQSTGSTTQFQWDTNDKFQYNLSGNYLQLLFGLVEEYRWDATAFNVNDNNITNVASAYFNERSAAQADTAGDGQLWVKNDTPNRIMFTDDAGTDIDLQTGYELLATGSLSGSTAIDISSYTDFRVLKLVVIAMTVTGDGNNVTLDASFDGGSTWASDSWSKAYQLMNTGDSAVTAGSASAAGDMYFSGGIGNAAGEYANTTMYLYGATQSAQTWVTAESLNINTSGTAVFQQLQGLETTVDIIDQLRITQANIDGGTYHLYGLRN